MHQFFSNLVRVQSIDKEIKLLLDQISDENDRLRFLEKTKRQKISAYQEVKAQLNELNKEIALIEKDIFDIDKRLEQIKGYENQILDEQTEKKLADEKENLEAKSDELQEKVLSILESVDEKTELEEEYEGFLGGIDNTIKEITDEVLDENKETHDQIKKKEEQIIFLLDEIPKNLLEAFESAQQKYRFNSPLTFLQSNSCRECHLSVDEVSAREVELGKGILHCHGCGRLICPSHGL
ncbi:MAG: hypothetical protein GY909_06575 [Oligoflexia bacterium]|nr:hypothetical protein [Oligoflexia bacterium]